MNKWREVKLGDIADIGTGKTNRQDETKNGSYPLFDRSSIIKRSDKYLFDCKAVIIPGEGKEFLPRYFSGKFDLHQRAYRITSKSEDNVQTKFLYYYLNQHRSYWERVAVGTTVKSLRLHSFVDFPVKLPPIEEQKAIVHILGTLDDKIELNQQMNETLESMAQAIFQDWFIDFGPTRRKMQGATDPDIILGGLFSTPEKTREIADLFPTTLTDNGLPKGWKKARLGDFDFEIESGKRPKGGIDKSLKFGIPSIGAENLAKVGNFDYSKVKFVDSDFAKFVKQGWVKNYDVAIYKDGAMVGNPNRVSLFGNNFPFSKFIVNEHVFLIRSATIGQPFLYFLFKSDNISSYLESIGSSKAAQPGLNQQEMKNCEFVFPARGELFMTFEKIILMFLDKQLANGKESCLLEKIRNLLLPNLISGQIIVRELEI